MVLAKGKLGDPKDPAGVVKFKRPKLKYDEIPPDMWSLGALVFSLIGVTMKMKGCAWIGAVFACAAIVNKRVYDADTQQIVTGAVFAFAAVAVNLITSYHGMKARAAEASGL